MYLNDLDPKAVRVELYADGIDGERSDPTGDDARPPSAGEPRGDVYRASVPAARAVTDYTARIIPHCSGVAVPLETAHILWQR